MIGLFLLVFRVELIANPHFQEGVLAVGCKVLDGEASCKLSHTQRSFPPIEPSLFLPHLPSHRGYHLLNVLVLGFKHDPALLLNDSLDGAFHAPQ